MVSYSSDLPGHAASHEELPVPRSVAEWRHGQAGLLIRGITPVLSRPGCTGKIVAYSSKMKHPNHFGSLHLCSQTLYQKGGVKKRCSFLAEVTLTCTLLGGVHTRWGGGVLPWLALALYSHTIWRIEKYWFVTDSELRCLAHFWQKHWLFLQKDWFF